jgi:hypothetical protein
MSFSSNGEERNKIFVLMNVMMSVCFFRVVRTGK